MSISWKNPPPVLVMGGSEQFLVQREIRNAKLSMFKNGIRTERVSTDNEVVDLLTGCGTFGDTCLIHIQIEDVQEDTIKDVLDNPLPKVCLLIECTKELPKKIKWLDLVPKKMIREHNIPTRQADKVKVAKRFLAYECDRLLGKSNSIEDNLVDAVVKVVGVDLGVLSFEATKYSLCAKYKGLNQVTTEVVSSLIKQGDDLDLDGLRQSLKLKDKKRLALSLYKIRTKSASDPTMLMLKGRGGPLDVLYNLLLVKQCLKQKKTPEEISSRLGIPLWILQKDLLTVAGNWKMGTLKQMVYLLAELESKVLKGCPNSWAACESILLKYI